MFAGLDLQTNQGRVALAIEPSTDIQPSSSTLNINSNWRLDSTTKIYLCSATTKIYLCSDRSSIQLSCFVESLVFWFEVNNPSTSDQFQAYMYGVSRKINI